MAEAFQGAVGEDGEMDAHELMNVLNDTGFISGSTFKRKIRSTTSSITSIASDVTYGLRRVY